MSENSNKIDKRVLLGGILIILGGIFFISTWIYENFNPWNIIFSWGSLWLVLGVVILVKTDKKILGSILSGIGLFLLLGDFIPQLSKPGIIIPIIFILLGMYIIIKKRKLDSGSEFTSDSSKVNRDKIDDVSIFGGGTKIISSSNFQGGNITAIFGGSEINLINCQLAEGDNVLDVLCVFGGTTIILPKEWDVVINVTSILGGFSNKAIRNPSVVIDQSRTLHIKGLAMFGGGEVKTYL